MSRILVFPDKRAEEGEEGLNLLSLLSRRGYAIPSACGGIGTCGKCRVLVREGVPAATEAEKVHLTEAELRAGWRLSCMQHIGHDMTIEIPEYEEKALAKELLRETLHVSLDSGVEKTYMELAKPSRHDQRPDTIRIQEALGQGQLDYPLPTLKEIPEVLKKGDFKVTVTCSGKDVVDFEPDDTRGKSYGVALDIGTTTIGVYLLNLDDGEELVVRSRINPQRRYGDDVISRLSHAHQHGRAGLRELQRAVVSEAIMLIRQMCRLARIKPSHIYKAAVVGNPTMIHLFLGIDPSSIGFSPFTPVLRDGLVLPARELGLRINPRDFRLCRGRYSRWHPVRPTTPR
jgi:uncharacterized 2Fe-2S/4Fe-4S cluster protein (DUF4445 family)